MTKADYKVPFAEDGSLLHYAETRYARPADRGVEWRPAEPFTAALTIATMHTGRSAKYTEWTDAAGRRFPMFIADLIEMLRSADVHRGTVDGFWTVRKRGQNYGVRFLPAAP